jgi:hypothetical protein
VNELAAPILAKFVGLPLWSAGRAGDLAWFHFGSPRTVVSELSGKEKMVGDLALHIQCAWRITSPLGIEVASRDIYYPASSEGSVDLSDFDWDRPGKNRCDERLSMLLASKEHDPLVVQSVQIDTAAGLKLLFTASYVLDVFPNCSYPIEQWRVFQPYKETPQLVFANNRIEID